MLQTIAIKNVIIIEAIIFSLLIILRSKVQELWNFKSCVKIMIYVQMILEVELYKITFVLK